MIIGKSKLSLVEWRAKKAARREKQRKINLLRASKMHKARLTIQTNSSTTEKIQFAEKLYIGCSGWFYWHWRGKIYPETSKTNEWFNLYCKKFQTVELNAPFYSWPTVNTVKTWYKQAISKGFVYTVKIPELITHIKKFVGTKELIKDFDLVADELGDKFGCFLYQCPPSFKFSSARLRRIVKQLNLNRRNVLEFRHISWWNQEVYNTFSENNIIFCSCSSPKFPDELIKTADEVYIRFHGKSKWYRHNYTKKELAEWVLQIKKSGANRVWTYFNNDRDGYAIDNAKTFNRLLKKAF